MSGSMVYRLVKSVLQFRAIACLTYINVAKLTTSAKTRTVYVQK